jgi:tRNA(Ile)-lysidine synthase
MQYKFNKHLETLLPDGPCNILVAVSGGADSMCLLDLLYNSPLELNISIAHMNFNLRGADSDSDEALVREWAASNGVRLFVKGVDTVSYAAAEGISIEMAARELRYNWFYSLKKEHGFNYIALAHHANDNAETLVLNMLRGSGIRGICGMKELDMQRGLLRPLLGYTRRDIEKYVSKKRIPFAVDCTNSDIEFHRNRIRNVVIPEFEKINPQAVNVLNRDMAYFSLAAGILDELAAQKKEWLVSSADDAGFGIWDSLKNKSAKRYMQQCASGRLVCAVDLEKLLSESHYKFWLYEILSGYGFNSAQVEDLAISLEHTHTTKISAEDYVAVKERGYIKVYARQQAIDVALEKTVGAPNGETVVEVEGKKVVFSMECAGDIAGRGEHTLPDCGMSLAVSAKKLHFPLMLRYVQPGDKFSPFGMKKGVKKVSDYLTDIKLDSELKGDLLVLCEKNNPSNIICLPGLEISDRYRVEADDSEILRITLYV